MMPTEMEGDISMVDSMDGVKTHKKCDNDT